MEQSERPGETSGYAQVERAERRVTTPLVGAVAGMMFAVLFGLSVALIRSSMGDLATDTGEWMRHGTGQFKLGVALMPFAGIFFLWFIAVVRDRLGSFEDRFFATVFLGSGLLFLAMMFAATAVGGAIVASYTRDPSGFVGTETYRWAREIVAQIFNNYALRMAGVFLISQATLWLRTGVMPRWMAFVTYGVAVTLLVVFSQEKWIVMIFPTWVFLVSLYILVVNLSGQGRVQQAG